MSESSPEKPTALKSFKRWVVGVAIGWAIATVILFPGCGTNANLTGSRFALMGRSDTPPVPFGGIKNDLRWLFRDAVFPVSLFFAIDLPASFVGDIVTLREIREKTTDYDLWNEYE